MRVYLREGSAQTILRAATLRWKLQIQLSISPSHSILTPGRPVPLECQFKVTDMTRPRKNPGVSGIRTRDLPLSRRKPYHQASEAVSGDRLLCWSLGTAYVRNGRGRNSANIEPGLQCAGPVDHSVRCSGLGMGPVHRPLWTGAVSVPSLRHSRHLSLSWRSFATAQSDGNMGR